jgi:hypothetical protein
MPNIIFLPIAYCQLSIDFKKHNIKQPISICLLKKTIYFRTNYKVTYTNKL